MLELRDLARYIATVAIIKTPLPSRREANGITTSYHRLWASLLRAISAQKVFAGWIVHGSHGYRGQTDEIGMLEITKSQNHKCFESTD
jgi:hypothetical protein